MQLLLPACLDMQPPTSQQWHCRTARAFQTHKGLAAPQTAQFFADRDTIPHCTCACGVCCCRYFKVSERGSTLGNEIKSGVVTFLTMSYILLVNPQILGAAGKPSTALSHVLKLRASSQGTCIGVVSSSSSSCTGWNMGLAQQHPMPHACSTLC